MAVLTYSVLKNYLISLAARQGDTVLEQNIDLYILFGQSEIHTDLNTLSTEKIVQGTIDLSISNLLPKPVMNMRCGSIILNDPLQDNKEIVLKNRNYSYLQSFVLSTDIENEPKYYTDFSLYAYQIAPVLPQQYQYTLRYYEFNSPLDESNQQNELTVYYPHILMAAVAYQMFIGLQSPELAAPFQGLYDKYIAKAMAQSQMSIEDNATKVENI